MNTERKKNREIKRQVRMDKRRWNKDFASESENAARQQHMKTFFPRLRYCVTRDIRAVPQ